MGFAGLDWLCRSFPLIIFPRRADRVSSGIGTASLRGHKEPNSVILADFVQQRKLSGMAGRQCIDSTSALIDIFVR